MSPQDRHNRLNAANVLRRYRDEKLPAFCEIVLEDVNQVGNFGERPLSVACVRGKMEEIEALVDAGAQVNASGELGNTPLHEAVGQAHVEAMKFLLDRGASPHVKNQFGETPVDKAKLASRTDIVKLLQNETYPSLSPLVTFPSQSIGVIFSDRAYLQLLSIRGHS
jgi:ankyrin repeat protein